MAAFRIAVPLLMLSVFAASPLRAEEIGAVNTNFKLFGSDKIVVEAFDDPLVGGVTCYVSKAKTGGLSGAVGVAEDTSDASIACRQTGPLVFKSPLPKKEVVFTERRSLVFKSLQVVRFVDTQRNALVYLTYSDRVVSGSPKNAITAVAPANGERIPVKP
ncbi:MULTISPECIES: CreA family protein [Limnobacter]|uniref:Protein CreA n=1 Tax=Limnobacter litoralis TaxID=481366 RepID=A0ABQ5YMH8_9BURK|nr:MULTISPECIES: CreA family protein [Limnobacter]GLR25319.1 protein CreA [Limnobacter litoralis]HEX5485514.1 CreA family protein [Limnobacter sp.]